MSLAARITLEPSRRVAWLERSMPLGGLAVAASCVAARWPASLVSVAVAGLLVAVVIVLSTGRRAAPLTLFVSARDDVALVADGDLPPDGWRLDEATLAWPSLSVVSLVRADGGPLQRRVVLVGDLPPRERRALSRFLLWSIRGRRAADGLVAPRDGG